MNREQTKELLSVMQAYADGRVIQYRAIDGGYWYDVTEDKDVEWDRYEYRVKPEVKYRPFASAEECWNEMQKHQPFGVIDHIDGYTYAFARLHENGIDFYDCFGEGFEYYYDNSKFADGCIFGIKEGGEE